MIGLILIIICIIWPPMIGVVLAAACIWYCAAMLGFIVDIIRYKGDEHGD